MTVDEYAAQRDRVFQLIDEALAKAQAENLSGASWLVPLASTIASVLTAMQRTGSKVTLDAVIAQLKDAHQTLVSMPVPTQEQLESLPAPDGRVLH